MVGNNETWIGYYRIVYKIRLRNTKYNIIICVIIYNFILTFGNYAWNPKLVGLLTKTANEMRTFARETNLKSK